MDVLRSVIVISFTVAAQAGAALPNVVLNDHPLAYYRLNDFTSCTSLSANSGSLGALANATNDLPLLRAWPGGLAGERDRSVFFDGSSREKIAWSPALNPPVSQGFTLELWC